jgi:hypothetical protein
LVTAVLDVVCSNRMTIRMFHVPAHINTNMEQYCNNSEYINPLKLKFISFI